MQSLDNLPKHHFGAILADPPWKFYNWSKRPYWERGDVGTSRAVERFYETMDANSLKLLPVNEIAADNAVLFIWIVWPSLPEALELVNAWGFNYKTCAFSWVKADNRQPSFFQEELKAEMKLGYWTRANSEVCLLATKGKPKRINADVRQAIIAPAREHSRKPDGIHERIERLVAGPYLELFARQERKGWTTWGNETNKFRAVG